MSGRPPGYIVTRKTNQMLVAEAFAGKPLEEALPELLNVRGLVGTAKYLQVAHTTVQYWCLKLGIRRKWVAIPKDYRMLLIPEEYLTDDVLRLPRIIANFDVPPDG